MAKLSIAALLREDPVDWSKVKKRAKTHSYEINKNFIHKLCLEPSVPPRFLEWALEQAPAQLLRKSGLLEGQQLMTPLEICLQKSYVPCSTFARIVRATHTADANYCPFAQIDFLEIDLDKLRVLLNTYEMKEFEEALEEFLLLPFFEQAYDWGDDDYGDEEGARLKLVLQAASRLWGSERTSNGVFCVAHTFLATVIPRYFDVVPSDEPDSSVSPSDLYYVLKVVIGYSNPHEFCVVDDQQGNTLLHYIMEFAARDRIRIRQDSSQIPYELDLEDLTNDMEHYLVDDLALTDRYWKGLMNMLLRKQQKLQKQPRHLWPPSCKTVMTTNTMVNKKGQTPLHIALLHGLPHAMVLVNASAAETLFQGLYPFQLAATATPAIDDDSVCDCEHCRAERPDRLPDFYIAEGPFGSRIVMHVSDDIMLKDDDTKKEDVALTNTYSLLRMAPHVLLPSMDDAGHDELLNCPIYKQIVMNELQAARWSRQHYEKMQRLQESTERLKKRIASGA